MEVTADIRRSDVIRLNLHLLPRMKANYIVFGVIAAAIFVSVLIRKRPVNIDSIAIAVIASLLGAFAALLAGVVVSLVCALLIANEKSGMLGRHTFRITAEGLHESTPVNTSLQKWAGIQSVGKSPNFIYLRINGYLFHVIPRRAFESQEAYELFWEGVLRFRESAS